MEGQREPLNPAHMGLILDSSVIIAAERQGKNAGQVLTAIGEQIGETEVGTGLM